jgi:hypothetical protein
MASELARLQAALSDPGQFARLLTIMDKQGRLVRLKHNQAQAAYFAHRRKARRGADLILKARQMGMTTALVAESLRIALTKPTRILTMIDSHKNTENVRDMVKRMYDSLPEVVVADGRHILKPKRIIDNATTIRFDNGSRWVIGTAGSVNTGRSGTWDVWHPSEVAYWTDPTRILDGAGQAAEAAYWKPMESTANGATGWWYERCMQALDGDADYTLHFFPWWWAAEYADALEPGEVLTYDDEERALVEANGLTPEQIKFRRRKQRELRHEFKQAYPEDPLTCFVHSGVGYFGEFSHAITAPANAEPNKDHRYVGGLDFGQQQDYTALVIADATERAVVDLLRVNKLPWQEIRQRVLARLRKWNVELVYAERNSMGGSEIEALRNEAGTAEVKAAIWSFDMTPTSKPPVMSDLYAGIHENGLRLLNDPVLIHELRAATAKQTSKGWTVESPRDQTGHGDTVVALALAWHAALRYGTPRR